MKASQREIDTHHLPTCTVLSGWLAVASFKKSAAGGSFARKTALKATSFGTEVGPPIFGTSRNTEDTVDTAACGEELRLVTCITGVSLAVRAKYFRPRNSAAVGIPRKKSGREGKSPVQELAELEANHPPVLFVFRSM